MIKQEDLWTEFDSGLAKTTVSDRTYVWNENPNVTKKFRWYEDRLVVKVDNGVEVETSVYLKKELVLFRYNVASGKDHKIIPVTPNQIAHAIKGMIEFSDDYRIQGTHADLDFYEGAIIDGVFDLHDLAMRLEELVNKGEKL